MSGEVTTATVRIPSAVPALDRDFAYLVPGELEDSIQIGSLVSVPFGRSNAAKNAYVISLAKVEEEETRSLKHIQSIVSPLAQFASEQLQFLQELAARQNSSFSELLAQAAPARSVRVEKRLLKTSAEMATRSAIESATGEVAAKPTQPTQSTQPTRTFVRLPATESSQLASQQSWCRLFINRAIEKLSQGQSALVLLPDFRDLAQFEAALEQEPIRNQALRFVATDSLTTRYENHLQALSGTPRLIYGLRTAVLAPAHQLALICALDESDSAFVEQSSPYWLCRDAALTRSNSAKADLLFASRIASAEIERLIEIGYVERKSMPLNSPAVHVNNTAQRLDETSFRLIRNALDQDRNVLVQVASLGHTTALFCRDCGKLARCSKCSSPLALTISAEPTCRYCKFSERSLCECGKGHWRWGRAGLDRVAEELILSFQDATVISASGADAMTEIATKRTIVVSTAGSEPKCNQGYAVALFIDADAQLSGNRLRNAEIAIRHWLNACAKLASGARVIFRISDSDFSRTLGRFAIDELSLQEWLSRKESGLPPARRLASISCSDQLTLSKMIETMSRDFECFRAQLQPNKIGMLYDYGQADFLKQKIASTLLLIPDTKQTRTGSGKIRTTRAVTVKYDDVEMI